MSDILIRGMEMPEHCGECKLKAEYDDETFCPFFTDNVEYWIAAGRRHEDCPLGYIQPHGRLIDADRILSDRMKRMYYHLENGDIAIPIIDIENAPTIIPTSE